MNLACWVELPLESKTVPEEKSSRFFLPPRSFSSFPPPLAGLFVFRFRPPSRTTSCCRLRVSGRLMATFVNPRMPHRLID